MQDLLFPLISLVVASAEVHTSRKHSATPFRANARRQYSRAEGQNEEYPAFAAQGPLDWASCEFASLLPPQFLYHKHDMLS